VIIVIYGINEIYGAGFKDDDEYEKLEAQGCKTRATNLCQFMRRYGADLSRAKQDLKRRQQQ
jgi:hypothetical protein